MLRVFDLVVADHSRHRVSKSRVSCGSSHESRGSGAAATLRRHQAADIAENDFAIASRFRHIVGEQNLAKNRELTLLTNAKRPMSTLETEMQTAHGSSNQPAVAARGVTVGVVPPTL